MGDFFVHALSTGRFCKNPSWVAGDLLTNNVCRNLNWVFFYGRILDRHRLQKFQHFCFAENFVIGVVRNFFQNCIFRGRLCARYRFQDSDFVLRCLFDGCDLQRSQMVCTTIDGES